MQNGGTIYERTEVTEIEERDDGIYVHTANGTIKARKSVVIGVHHASFKLLPAQSDHHPFYTYVCTTAPLEVDLTELLPSDHPVYDTQFQIDYYRGVSKNRLLLVVKAREVAGALKNLSIPIRRINKGFPAT